MASEIASICRLDTCARAAGTSAVPGLPDVLHMRCSLRYKVHLSGSYQEWGLVADPQDPREGTHTLSEPVAVVQEVLMPGSERCSAA